MYSNKSDNIRQLSI